MPGAQATVDTNSTISAESVRHNSGTWLPAQRQTFEITDKIGAGQGLSVGKAAKDLGISESALRRWIEAFDIEQGKKPGLTCLCAPKIGQFFLCYDIFNLFYIADIRLSWQFGPFARDQSSEPSSK
ncbi:MAG: helix-turn-helix domain-containing protein [Myxococcota bacterium]|nr:helix-turn-helix domain-containing protein [Myxococcota bacterium]